MPYPANSTLTTGADSFTGTVNNDTFNASDVSGASTVVWTVGDKLDGGAGVDTLNITTATAINGVPTGATVSNIENVNIINGSTVSLDTTSGFSGLTKLTSQSTGGAVVTAGGTTALSITNTDAAAGSQPITINGGSSVAVVSKNNVGDVISVGATTAATGAVTVSSTGGAANGNTAGTIGVTGGTTISVSQLAGNKGATGNDTVGGAITVTGNASTKEVTVTQTKTATGADATATAAAVVGYTAGAVDVLDANRASATAAGTIETVSITNAGAAVVNSGALKTLNLGGSLVTVNAGTLGALTTAANSTLAVNLNGATSTGAVTIDTDIKTLNVASSTAASTINSLVANGATTVNVSGDAALTLTGQTLGAVTNITVTNTAGASFGSALAAGVTFTGGAGADKVTLSDSFTKVITMGAGNDTVTVGGTTIGTGGSVAAGEGIDTIVMTAAQAAAFDDNATFNSKFSGFEILELGASGANTINLAGINGVNTVVTGGATGALVLAGFAANGTLKLTADAAGGSYAVEPTNALFNAADVFNIELSKSTLLAAGSITAAGVETINIKAADAATAGSAAVVHTATLVATGATTVNVSGNNGLTLTNTGNAAITTFDASGVVGNGTADTAANLAVTFASANNTADAVVKITGGAGNDVLSGGAAKDTINGGAGHDLINGGVGQDTITLGVGRDIVQIVNNDQTPSIGSGTSAADIVNGFKMTDAAISAVDLSSNGNFQGSTAGGSNLNLLNIDLTTAGGANQALTVEANGTGAGQAAGVTYTVKDGILTLSGAGAAAVDTLAEWIAEAAGVAATNGDILAFQFGSDTYVYAQNGNTDMMVQLVGVTGAASLVEVSNSTTAAANSILYADIV